MISPYQTPVKEITKPGTAIQLPGGMDMTTYKHITHRLFLTVDGWYNIDDGKPFVMPEDAGNCFEIEIPDTRGRRY